MTIHDSDVSLPSPGSAQEMRSPGSSVLSRRCDSLMSVSLHFVVFDPRYHGSTGPRFRSRRRHVRSMRRAWSLLTRRLRPGIMHVETPGFRSFRGASFVRLPMFTRPRPDECFRPFAKRPCCPRSFNDEGSDDSTVEAQLHGFRTRCLRLAVQVTRTPRKTRSRPPVRLYRTGLSPAKAPLKGFRLNFS